MGLGSLFEKTEARIAIGMVAKRYPMLKDAAAWILEPGRKRRLTTIAAVLDVGLHHADQAFAELCQKGITAVCNVHVAFAGDAANQLGAFVDSLTSSADVVTLGMGLWSIGHALYRRAQGKTS